MQGIARHIIPSSCVHDAQQAAGVCCIEITRCFLSTRSASAGAVKGGGTLSIRPPERDKCSMKPLKPFRTEKSARSVSQQSLPEMATMSQVTFTSNELK